MVARAPEAPVFLGGDEAPAEAPAVAEGISVEPPVATGRGTTTIRLREEGGGQPYSAGESPLQSGAATRQVVGPSPSEHTPVAGIPEATVKGVVLPNPVKREQAGSESDRTVSGEFRVEQMESFHDGGSNDVPAVSVSASDSFVRESSSGYAALQTGNVSVETQGRRQAAESRAGSTTLPDGFAGEAVETMVPERADESASIGSPRTAGEEIPVHRAKEASKLDTLQEEASRPVGSELFASETDHESLPATIPAAATRSPVSEPPGHRANERQLPPLPRDGGEGKIPVRPLPPPEPQVRIGTIEVVVVAPAPTERPSRSEERSRPDLASRHYLRNF